METTRTTSTVGEAKARQLVWAQWMQDATAGLADTDQVVAVRQVTPFGTYLVGLAVR